MKNKQGIYKIMCLTLIIDQIIKIIIRHSMTEYQEIKIIKKFFSILYVENTGAAFSILKDSTLLLIIISVLFIILLGSYIKKEAEKFTKLEIISYGLILGGIFGNLIDRIIHRKVTDYLSFTIIKYEFPVFNFADTCIVVGAIILLIYVLFLDKKNRRQNGLYKGL